MTKVAIFCVTYNTYEELAGYYHSICQAAERARGRVAVDFFVADNTTQNACEIVLAATSDVKPVPIPFHENLGYLGAVQKMMRQREADVSSYDYVAISNVDLTMAEDALLRLCEKPADADTGWIAPALLSVRENRDRNPGVMRRYTACRLKLLRVMFLHPLLVAAYRATLYRRHRAQRNVPSGQTIYAGHGSFMLFTKAYFQRCGLPQSPMFLYGEELYFAEQCRAHGLMVVYCPAIKLMDQEHASVGKMPRAALCRYNRESLGYILRTFY